MFIYCHLSPNQLYPGTIRNWSTDMVFREFVERIKDSIKEVGFMNPLSCGNEKDDGTYRVNRGNNCLQAAIELNIKSIPCIVYCGEDRKYIPEGEQVQRSELQKFHKSEIKKITKEDPTWFGVYLVDEWAPH